MCALNVHQLRTECLDPWSTKVFTLRDLENWRFPGFFLGVMGSPIAHSMSPQMHRAALNFLSIEDQQFKDWRYIKLQVEAEGLLAALPLAYARGFQGFNLTSPLKAIACSCVQKMTDVAHKIGAINTLIRTATGFMGDNTDAQGLDWALTQTIGENWYHRPIVVWGAGGAARAAVYLAIQRSVRCITVVNRSLERLECLHQDFEPLLPSGTIWNCHLAPHFSSAFKPGTLHIQCIPLSLDSDHTHVIPMDALHPDDVIYDMAYAQDQTPLVQLARKRGHIAYDGRSMLAAQGTFSLKAWTGRLVPISILLNAIYPLSPL